MVASWLMVGDHVVELALAHRAGSTAPVAASPLPATRHALTLARPGDRRIFPVAA
jgi:hypothetical protein